MINKINLQKMKFSMVALAILSVGSKKNRMETNFIGA